MGMPHRDVEERLDAIVEYAELGQFIDAPIKTYSSGMRARLGFAIATSVDPDILLLDEVLATGDAAFREKSKQRVLELVGGGEGDRPGDPRHELGPGVLQPGDAHRAGPDRAEGAPDEVVSIHRDHMAQRRAQAKEKGVFAKKARLTARPCGGGPAVVSRGGAAPTSPAAPRARRCEPRSRSRPPGR